MWMELFLTFGALILWWLYSLQREENRPALPRLYFCKGSQFVKDIIQQAVILRMTYIPPLLWGRNGHYQSMAYGILGNRRSKRWLPEGTRKKVICSDGATVSFDVFEPLDKHWSGDDITFLICPGIANSAESVYIRSFVVHSQQCGYRCYVLNHLGVVPSVKLTAARLFTYGGTDEFAMLTDYVLEKHPLTKAVAVGFSMGGNVVTCYLGKSAAHQKKFLCGISVCQGYDIVRSRHFLLQWTQMRRGYMFNITRNMKRIMARNRDLLFSKEIMAKHPKINLDGIFRATTMLEIDEHYTKVILGYDNVDEFYREESCYHKLQNINIPMLFVNALDDPIVPESLLDYVKNYAQQSEKALLVVTRHGGHLGFFEGDSYVIPEPVSWLCRLVAQYTDAVLTRDAVHDEWTRQTMTFDQSVVDANGISSGEGFVMMNPVTGEQHTDLPVESSS